MAEKMKDAEDRMLESLLRPETIADDGFSARVVGRIRRQMWVRRLALPLAVTFGGMIAFKPAIALLTIGSSLAGLLPTEVIAASSTVASQLPVILAAGMGLAIAMLLFRMLEE